MCQLHALLNLGSRNPGGKIFGNYSIHCCCCGSDVISHDHHIVCQYPVSLCSCLNQGYHLEWFYQGFIPVNLLYNRRYKKLNPLIKS